MYTDGRMVDVPVVPASALVDPTGCGDAFRAGLLYGIAHGWSVEKAASWAAWWFDQDCRTRRAEPQFHRAGDSRALCRSVGRALVARLLTAGFADEMANPVASNRLRAVRIARRSGPRPTGRKLTAQRGLLRDGDVH